jgi:MFS family permease
MCVQLGTFGSKVLFMPLVGRMVRRMGPGRVLWLGAITTAPAAVFWVFADPWWLLVLLQVYVGFGWACWENGSFLLTFDTIPEDRRTPIMTVYQLALASVMVAGSLVGGGILEIVGTERISIAGGAPVVAGYFAVFVLTSGMRLVSLFMLASIEPSGLKIRHRARRVLVWTIGAVPGMPGGEIEADVEDDR